MMVHLAPAGKQTILVTMERTRIVSWRDPSEGADSARALSGLEWLRAMAKGEAPFPPFASFVGFRLEDVNEGDVVVTLEPQEFHLNPSGVFHGGVAATLFDSSLGCAVQSLLPPGCIAPTLQLQVNYIRPVTMGTGKVFCSGKVVHMGKRSATAEGRLTDGDGKLYAHATGTFILTGPEDNTAR